MMATQGSHDVSDEHGQGAEIGRTEPEHIRGRIGRQVEEQLELVTNPMVLPSYNFEVHDIGPKLWTQ